jgi:hypothetical protein
MTGVSSTPLRSFVDVPHSQQQTEEATMQSLDNNKRLSCQSRVDSLITS